MNNPYFFKGVNPTVDLIIFNPDKTKMLLVRRGEDSSACAGMWAIPGGFIDTDAKQNEPWKEGRETPPEAAVRELAEEANLVLVNPELIFIGEFEGNNRDPRDNEESWSKSYAFVYVIDEETFEAQKDNIKGMDDVDDFDWKTIEEARRLKLAFDHNKIIESALEILQKQSNKRKFSR